MRRRQGQNWPAWVPRQKPLLSVSVLPANIWIIIIIIIIMNFLEGVCSSTSEFKGIAAFQKSHTNSETWWRCDGLGLSCCLSWLLPKTPRGSCPAIGWWPPAEEGLGSSKNAPAGPPLNDLRKSKWILWGGLSQMPDLNLIKIKKTSKRQFFLQNPIMWLHYLHSAKMRGDTIPPQWCNRLIFSCCKRSFAEFSTHSNAK